MKIFNKVSAIILVALFMLGFSRPIIAQTVNLIPPLINVTTIPHPIALPESGPVTYDYTVLNVGIVSMSNVTIADNTCAGISFISGDANGNSKLDSSEIWKYHCETMLSQTTTSTATVTGQANGFTAVDTANATIFIGVPLPPPLIHLEKIPNMFVLPFGGGAVTYTYAVTNPGPAPLSDVSVTDDKCTGLPGRVLGHPGDLNKNDLLEANETWSFTCQTNITETTTNIGTARGFANGLTAVDSSSTTVAVSLPGLPNTGYLPLEKSVPWQIIIPTGILFILFSFYLGKAKMKQLKDL